MYQFFVRHPFIFLGGGRKSFELPCIIWSVPNFIRIIGNYIYLMIIGMIIQLEFICESYKFKELGSKLSLISRLDTVFQSRWETFSKAQPPF